MNIRLQKTKKRAAEITKLQRGYTSGGDEQRIVELITSTRGPELTQLKLEIDSGDGDYDLLELLYHDVDDEGRRARLVDHIEKHSPKVAKEDRDIRVISDIDDTLYSSLHEERYRRGTNYPGVLSFHSELAQQGKVEYGKLRDLILLTARPRDHLGLVERFTKNQMLGRGFGDVVVLSGSLTSLFSHEAMAQKKLENFSRYQQLYPEFDFLFVGDSGQGDAALGEMMLEEFPDRTLLVLIHQLNGCGMQSDRLINFHTYLGAAVALMERGLISRAACSRIGEAVKDDIATVSYSKTKQLQNAYAAYLLDAARL